MFGFNSLGQGPAGASSSFRHHNYVLGIVVVIAFVLTRLGPASAQLFGERQDHKTKICSVERTSLTSEELKPVRMAIESTMIAIDRSLALTQQQADRFRSLLESEWQSDWTESAIGARHLPEVRAYLETLSLHDLREFLRPSQLAALSGPDQITLDVLIGTPDIMAVWSVDDFAEHQRAYFESVAKLKMEEIQSLCDLTTTEIEGLEKASMEVIDRLIEQQRLAYQQLQRGAISLSLNADGLVADSDVNNLQTPAAMQLSNASVWKNEVKECIKEECFAKYLSREQHRKTASAQLSK